MNMNKNELRKAISLQRTNMDTKVVSELSGIICQKLLDSDYYKKASQIFAYSSIRNEVICDTVIKAAFKDGKKVALPKVLSASSDCTMEFYYIHTLNQTDEGYMKIQEPSDTACTSPAIPDSNTLIIVPGIVFDKNLYRIGFGKGFYDRYFTKYQCDTHKVALCYDFQLMDSIPHDRHDIPVNAVITN